MPPLATTARLMDSMAAASAAAAAGGSTVAGFLGGSLIDGTWLLRDTAGLSKGAGAGTRGAIEAGTDTGTAGSAPPSWEPACCSSGSTDLDQGAMVGSAFIQEIHASPGLPDADEASAAVSVVAASGSLGGAALIIGGGGVLVDGELCWYDPSCLSDQIGSCSAS